MEGSGEQSGVGRFAEGDREVEGKEGRGATFSDEVQVQDDLERYKILKVELGD